MQLLIMLPQHEVDSPNKLLQRLLQTLFLPSLSVNCTEFKKWRLEASRNQKVLSQPIDRLLDSKVVGIRMH